MATCHSCPPGDQQVPDHDMGEHLRVVHPEAWGEGPERWPDGQTVVYDMTLEADDFGPPS